MVRRTATEIGIIEQIEQALFAGDGYQRPVLESKNIRARRTQSRSWTFKYFQLSGVNESINLVAFGASFSTVSPIFAGRRIVGPSAVCVMTVPSGPSVTPPRPQGPAYLVPLV